MKKNLTIFESGSCFIFAMLAMTLFQTVFSLAFTNSEIEFGGMKLSNWVIYAANQIAIISVVAIFLKVKKTDFLYSTKLSGKLNIKQIILLPFISVFTIVAFLPLSQIFANLLFALGWEGAVSTPLSSDIGVYFLSLFVIALLPAFGEELLMRGALLSGLKSRTPAFAVLISALMFSLMHANAIQTVHQFFFGIVLCVTCLWSKSLIVPIILHFLNNFISLTITAYVPMINNFNLGAYNYLLWVGCILVGLFVLTFLLFLFREFSNENKKSSKVWSETKYENFSLYTTDESAAELIGQKSKNLLAKFADFFKSLFSKRGWKNISKSLEDETSYTSTKNNESVAIWFALGFVAFWWLVALIQGFL
ncbi:MAG TPA: type II CAAX endopeptidase family protein [Clostridia bacterium]|nr:type II CAAX endopeptidase family protein [Clostridia bacterium]